MKSTSIATAFFAGLSIASPLQKRQNAGGIWDNLMSMMNPMNDLRPTDIKEIKPKIRATATRKLMRYGPFTLPANKDDPANAPKMGEGHGAHPSGPSTINPADILLGVKGMDPNGINYAKMLAEGSFCTDCTVLGGRLDIVFANGTRAETSGGVYLHHVIALDLTKAVKPFTGLCPDDGGFFTGTLNYLTSSAGLNVFIGGAVVSTLSLWKL
jgi:hypothetical protein